MHTALSVSSNLASTVLMIVASCLSTSSSSPSLPLVSGVFNPGVSITVNPIFSPLSMTSTPISCISLVAPVPPNLATLAFASASPCPRASCTFPRSVSIKLVFPVLFAPTTMRLNVGEALAVLRTFGRLADFGRVGGGSVVGEG